MTISRKQRSREIYFECDAKRCANVCDTQLDDFNEALEEAREQGWEIRKEGNDWKHYCPDERDDSEPGGCDEHPEGRHHTGFGLAGGGYGLYYVCQCGKVFNKVECE